LKEESYLNTLRWDGQRVRKAVPSRGQSPGTRGRSHRRVLLRPFGSGGGFALPRAVGARPAAGRARPARQSGRPACLPVGVPGSPGSLGTHDIPAAPRAAGRRRPAAEGKGGRRRQRRRGGQCWPRHGDVSPAQEDVSLMESEETSEGGTTPPEASSTTGEAWDSTAVEREHHASCASAKMNTSLSDSAKGAELSTPKDCLAAPGKAAEMLGRPSNPVQKMPAGLEEEQGDAEPQKGVSELEEEMLLEEGGLHCSLNRQQVELVDLESNQDSSFLSTVQDGLTTGNAILQAVDLSTEFPQCQAELAFHGSDPPAQRLKSPLADATSSQRETPKCLLVCKTVSEGHYKAEPFLDKVSTDSLQEIDAGAGQKQSSEKVAPATDEQPTSEEAVEDMAKPYSSEDAQESVRALKGLEENRESSSSHQLSSALRDDSQESSLQAEEHISSDETGNRSSIRNQGTVMVPEENSSTSKCLHLENDHRQTEGRPASPAESAFEVKDIAEGNEEVNTSQHKESAQEEAVSELQQEKKKECKEQNLPEGGRSLESKDQKNKEQNKQEQQQREELKLEALSSAFGSEISSVHRHNMDLCCLENVFLAEQIRSAFPPGEPVSGDQHSGDVLLKAHVAEASSGSQPPAVSPLSSNNLNPEDETPVVPPHTCYISDHAEDLEDSGRFSIGGQDIGEADWDDRTRLGKEDEYSDGHGKAVQRFEKRDVPPHGGVAASSSTEDPEASVTAHPSSGTKNLELPDPTDPHSITENFGKAELQSFIPALPSELTSVVSTSGPQQQGGSGTASVTPEDHPGSNLNKLLGSVEKPEAASVQVQDPTSGAETAVGSTDPGEADASHHLLTSEESFHEDLSGPSSFSVICTSCLPLEGIPPEGRRTLDIIAGPLEQLQTLGRTSTPLNHPGTVQQNPPEKSGIIQEKKMGANVDQQMPLLDQSDCSVNQEEPGSRISRVLSNLTWPSEEDMVHAMNQPEQPLSRVSHSSLPLVSETDAKQFVHPPSIVQSPCQPQAPALDANHLTQPPALESYQPLAPVIYSIPHLSCGMEDNKLLSIHPAISHSVRAATSVSDSTTVASASDGEHVAEDDLVPLTREWELGDSGTHDTETSYDSGVSLLAKSFSAVGNEALAGCSDANPEIVDQPMDMQCGKSPPDRPSWPSLEGLITSTGSKNRNSAQQLPMLAFTNPIHFLQLSPPSPPTTRRTCQEEDFSGDLLWEQQAGIFGMDTKNIQAPLAITEKMEGERRVKQRLEGGGRHLVAQPKEEVPRHSPLEKSSSWPDKKPIGVVAQEPAAHQENPIKRRVKSKDWHRQGLKRMSVPPDILQEIPSVPSEEEAHKSHREPPISSETVILREKKPADAMENFKRRHSKLINSSRLLYQEYSDVVLNKAIQSQKRVDSFSEDIESSFPSSPRLRRKVLSPQDSYLQRLSISSNASLWQDIPMIRGSRMLLNMSRDEQKLQEAKFELIMSEASYLRSLNVAVDHFQRSAELQAMLTNQERQWLFSRLQDVRDVSASFLFDLEEKFEEDMFTFHVCDVALKHAPEFRRVYLPYVTNQTYQEQTFQRLLNGNAGFQQVLERLESDPVCQRLSLKSFLILPFQRITRLKLLLQNILKRTRPGSEEEVQATQAYDALEKLIKDCNENVQRMKSTEELIYLSQKIEFECKIFPLISQSRRLVKCGELTALDFNTLSPKWKVTTRPIYLHLFNDCLLLSRPKEGGRFVVFDHAAFSDVRGEKCEMKLHGTNKNVFRLFLLQNYQGKRVEFLFRTETHSEKLRWISALAPPRGELDLLECPDAPQVQCIKTYKARENDELALEKADIIMVMQYSNDGWIEGVKLSDRERGWFPSEHVELISSKHARQKNLKEEQRVKNAKQQVFCKK
ncbi:rho guanine nucleotide exchange factor 5, partial [Guaruba guarouba]